MSYPRNDFIDFVPGKLSAFTGFRALRHLYLQLVRIDEVVRGDPKARRRDLLHGAAPQVSVRIRFEAFFVFAAFAGIGLPPDAVHGDGQSLVRFFADRAE